MKLPLISMLPRSVLPNLFTFRPMPMRSKKNKILHDIEDTDHVSTSRYFRLFDNAIWLLWRLCPPCLDYVPAPASLAESVGLVIPGASAAQWLGCPTTAGRWLLHQVRSTPDTHTPETKVPSSLQKKTSCGSRQNGRASVGNIHKKQLSENKRLGMLGVQKPATNHTFSGVRLRAIQEPRSKKKHWGKKENNKWRNDRKLDGCDHQINMNKIIKY